MSNSVEWLIEKCACADLRPELWEIIKQQAREMHKKEMSYDDGYKAGYDRALDYMIRMIKDQLKVKSIKPSNNSDTVLGDD